MKKNPKSIKPVAPNPVFRKWPLWAVGLVAAFALGAGSFAAHIFFGSSPSLSGNITGNPVRLGATGLINPLLFVQDGPNPSVQLDSLKATLTTKIQQIENQGSAADVGVYVREINMGKWTGVNENHQFSLASLLKVPVMMAYLKLREVNPTIANDIILYNGSFDDNRAENIKPLKEIEAGKSYTADQLLEFMIQYSDNNAMDLLIEHIGADAIGNVYSNMEITQPSSTADALSPKTFAAFFRVLYSATYLNPAMSQKAMELLSYSDFAEGIEAGVPANITVASKFGERNFIDQTQGPAKELHDCGVVYHPLHPYLICVMTRGSDFLRLEGVIRDISALAWGSFNQLN